MTRTRTRIAVATAVAVALALVIVGVLARSDRPGSSAKAHLISMSAGAQAMQQAGQTMQAHGQAMLDEGQRSGDLDLITHGQHWLQDGQALVQGGQWMAMNPTAPGSLVSNPGDLSAQGSWGELNRSAQEMLHDPSKASGLNLEALNWNGEAMQAEGRIMADHGRLMAEDAELMVERHNLDAQAATDLRAAAQTMIAVGGHLQQNGKEMIDYAEQLKKSLGY